VLRSLAGLVLGLAVGPGCSLYDQDPLELATTRTIATELPVVGIDSDGAGGLWIASARNATADYYAHDEVRVVHQDATGAEVARFEYNDEYTDVSGLAFSGDAVWLNYGATGTGNNHVRKLDPHTGERLGSYATGIGVVDLDVRGSELLLSNLWNEVIALDLATGAVSWRAPIAGFEDSTQRGIASTDDDALWVASWSTPKLFLLDANHELIGSGAPHVVDRRYDHGDGLHLAWDGTHVIVALDHQISWVAP
jgi:outer membrane protein assembly factor BamB